IKSPRVLALAPRTAKTSDKPATKASPFHSKGQRPLLSRAEPAEPAIMPRYAGSSGKQQGERKDSSPKPNASSGVSRENSPVFTCYSTTSLSQRWSVSRPIIGPHSVHNNWANYEARSYTSPSILGQS